MFESVFNDTNREDFPLCAYDKKFMKEIPYRSDSRREWRNGCVCKEIEGFNGKNFQLLIHPIWWTDQIKTRDQNIFDFKDLKKHQAEEYLEDNLSFYKKSI